MERNPKIMPDNESDEEGEAFMRHFATCIGEMDSLFHRKFTGKINSYFSVINLLRFKDSFFIPTTGFVRPKPKPAKKRGKRKK